MSKLKLLNAFLTERLTAAAVEIFGAVEITIVEYHEEISRAKEENKRLQRVLDSVLQPDIKLHRADLSDQTFSVSEEEVPLEQQDWSPSLGQEEPEPTTSQEGEEQFQELKSHTNDSILTLPCLKTDFPQDTPDATLHPYPIKVEEDSEIRDLHRADLRDQAFSVSGEEVPPEQQDWSPVELGQEDPEPTTSQGEEQFQELRQKSHTNDSIFTLPCDFHQDTPDAALHSYPIQIVEDSGICDLTTTPASHIKTEPEGYAVSETTSDSQHPGTENIGPYGCHICGKCFDGIRKLTNHMREHTVFCVEGQYQCNVCDKHFKYKDELLNHTRAHSRERGHQCHECGKSFKHRGDLIRHTRIHTGERPYHCQICKNRFKAKAALTVHMRVHSGERPYRCHVCGMCFITGSNLKVHMRSHTGEAPYSCHVCGKTFKQTCNMVEHFRTNHKGQGPYKCNHCSQCFFDMSSLRIHEEMQGGKHVV